MYSLPTYRDAYVSCLLKYGESHPETLKYEALYAKALIAAGLGHIAGENQ